MPQQKSICFQNQRHTFKTGPAKAAKRGYVRPMSVKRVAKKPVVVITGSDIWIEGKAYEPNPQQEVVKFVRDFDARKTVHPFSFELDL